MPRALVDTTVLYGAAYQPDATHDDALALIQGIDDGSLPEAIILEYVLAETLNGLHTHAGHEASVDFLDRLEENARFHIEPLRATGLATGKALFRRYESLSFVDACLIAYMQQNGLGYLYAFDEDFDVIDDVYRLHTPTNPYEPDSK